MTFWQPFDFSILQPIFQHYMQFLKIVDWTNLTQNWSVDEDNVYKLELFITNYYQHKFKRNWREDGTQRPKAMNNANSEQNKKKMKAHLNIYKYAWNHTCRWINIVSLCPFKSDSIKVLMRSTPSRVMNFTSRVGLFNVIASANVVIKLQPTVLTGKRFFSSMHSHVWHHAVICHKLFTTECTQVVQDILVS